MKGVFVFLADGFEEIEALATVDILRRGGIDVKTVSISHDRTVL
ncbi:MAG: DJ-1/PfpI family protein, partial [Bacteroidales bacterium]|nr:DJ-1/PfpI family protein [Bacteroidales bacterium]